MKSLSLPIANPKSKIANEDMEVLMTRRASRTLMGVLSVTTVVGLSAYAITHRNSSTTSGTTPLAKPGTVALMAVAPAASETPATKPAGEVKPDAKAEARPAAATIAPTSKNTLVEGKAKIDGGELIAGRQILNEALMSGQLGGPDAATARQLISEANQSIVFKPRRFSDDPWAGSHNVVTGENLQKISFKYGLTPEFLLRINGMTDARKLRANSTIKILNSACGIGTQAFLACRNMASR